MKFTVRHIFNTDIDTYWSKIFFDREYNQRLFVDALSFPVYEVLELTEEPNGVRRRKVRTEPKADAPAVVTKLIGDCRRSRGRSSPRRASNPGCGDRGRCRAR